MRARSIGALVAGIVVACLFAVIGLAFFVVVNQAQAGCAQATQAGAAAAGVGAAEIPGDLMPLYEAAAQRYGLGPSGWAWLAAINKQETDFGRNLSVSSAGAIGWMQFMPATWAKYGVDGNGDGDKNPYQPADAIYGAANYLRASGAPGDWHNAVAVYGAAEWYFQEVAARAQSYLASPAAISVSSATGAPSVRAPALTLATGSQTTGLTVTGYTSTFGDHRTTSGIPGDGTTPGIAVLNAQTVGGYWKVTYPNGYTLVLQQIDVGPAPGLGPGPEHRVIDTNYAAASAAGYTLGDFPTDRGMVAATYLGTDQRFAAMNGQVVDASLPAGDNGASCMPSSLTGVSGTVAAAADQLAAMRVPYNYGGGHVTPAKPTAGQDGSFDGLDCSSSVSWVLQHAAIHVATMTSGEFMTWGDPGPGTSVSIYANTGHVFMKINGRYFGTSGFGHPAGGSGPAWFTANPSPGYLAGFVTRHPPGL